MPSEKELIEIAGNDEPMHEYELIVNVRSKSPELVEDWFCRTVMGETGICEIDKWVVY